MCLLAIAWQVDAEYPLVVCANRDEFFARPTRSAHAWQDIAGIFGGRDLQGGGTWMAIRRHGRLAALTNIRNPSLHREDALSRGLLVSRFLQGDQSALDYCRQLQERGDDYNSYNLIAFDGHQLCYQSNAGSAPKVLAPGIYGLSNAMLHIDWPKTQSAVQKLQAWLNAPGSVQNLAGLLADTTIASDDRLPATGVAQDLERALSAEFIQLQDYGTRCSTGLLVHRSGRADFCEITHADTPCISQETFHGFLPAAR